MANLRQIRSRIRSVQNTQKITRAMQMVAGAKLRRTQEQLFQARPYVDRLEGITRRFLEAAPTLTHPLLETPCVEEGATPPPMALVLIASDTGLCGSYNERLIAKARQVLAETEARVVPIGRKAVAAARRHGWRVLATHTDLGGKVAEPFVQELSTALLEAYRASQVRGVQVLYTAYRSALSWRPALESWLPLQPPHPAGQRAVPALNLAPGAGDRPGDIAVPYLFEPAPEEIAERLLPAYVTAKLRRLLLEAMTSEHSARMVAMKAATDNAAEMIDSLTLTRNKVRQAAITKEISEIVAGVEALNA